MATRFLDKGYNSSDIHNEIEKVRRIDSESILAGAQRVTQRNEYSLILDYNVQHKKFELIIAKHWSILKHDRLLGPVLPSRPKLIYRKAPFLRDRVAPGVVNPPFIADNRFLRMQEVCGMQNL